MKKKKNQNKFEVHLPITLCFVYGIDLEVICCMHASIFPATILSQFLTSNQALVRCFLGLTRIDSRTSFCYIINPSILFIFSGKTTTNLGNLNRL